MRRNLNVVWMVGMLAGILCGCYSDGANRSAAPSETETQERLSQREVALLDDYLWHWDNFAQGHEDVDYINDHQQEFFETLLRGLEIEDPRTVPRCVFFFFVQVFYYVPENSEIYSELHRLSEGDLEARLVEGEGNVLDSSQVWIWWKEHSDAYPRYELLENWLIRPFAQEEVIPLYESLAQSY